MKILAIETSCDDTAICLIQATETPDGVSFAILGNKTHSQIDIHQEFGGVFPALAKREHIKNLPIVFEQVMQEARSQKTEDIKTDVICVTSGPGLEPALWTGIVFAQELGKNWNVPVVPVNHMEGHILSVLVPEAISDFCLLTSDFQFPALALLISGGHTELVLVRSIGDYEIIGKTVDDAVGEAFDKVARMMGLPYPGGPEISKLASKFQGENAITFPRPMIHSKDYNFSFSGLKTAVLYYIRDLKNQYHPALRAPLLKGGDSSRSDDFLNLEQKCAISHEFQNAVADVLVSKTRKAVQEFGAQTLIIGGGVSANVHIKNEMKKMLDAEFPEIVFLTPTRELSTDNAVMIALAGYFKIKKVGYVPPDPATIIAEGNLSL